MGEAHAAYIAREGKYSTGNRYEDLEHTASGNMPKWAEHNPAEFWRAADQNERANGSVYRELEIALPRELTPDQRRELVQEFIDNEIGESHAYQYAIHTPKAALEKGEQPHAHIMYSERIRDGIERDPEQYFKRYNAKHPEKGGAKKFSGGKSANELKAELLEQRERWATLQNSHLEKHGHDSRVDHRSLKDQGINEREPEKHLGGSGVRNTSAKNNLLELRAATVENLQAQAEAAPLVQQYQKDNKTLEGWEGVIEKARQRIDEENRHLSPEARADLLADKKAALIENIESGKYPRTPKEQPQPRPADDLKTQYYRQAREEWKANELKRYRLALESVEWKYNELQQSEPKEPKLFGKKDWT
ncbi:MobA/MobL family protein, partial [Methylicorpusculum sp.]|uniref:MobA/MobL family protein n=1 Tax=Methylicorpusculum sp. TaxID=2713644 RepID=UPI002ABA866A